MKSANGFVQAYNARIAVETDFQLIVGQVVTQETNDKKQVAPKRIEAYIATDRQKHGGPRAGGSLSRVMLWVC